MRFRFLGTVAVYALLASFEAAAVPVLSFNPASGNVDTGGNSIFDIRITGAVDVYAYQFDVGFTPGIIALNSVSEGSFLSSGGLTFFDPGIIDNASGTLSYSFNSLLSPTVGVSGNGVLAGVGFSGLAAGVSSLTIFNVVLLDSSLSNLAFTTVGGSVAVSGPVEPTTVPEPGAFGLLAVGIAIQWLFRIRNARRIAEGDRLAGQVNRLA